MTNFLSIGIPTWEYKGSGAEVLLYSFRQMEVQTFKDFDLVISDHSKDDKIKDLCDDWSDRLDIHYFKNENGYGQVAPNLNNVLKNCTGKYIKFLDQDDYLYDPFSLERTVDLLVENPDASWLASAYVHTFGDRTQFFNPHYPMLNNRLFMTNTIGTCSCVTIRNYGDEIPRFDENLSYHHDCSFYQDFILKFGNPVMLYVPTITNYLWNQSTTSGVTQELMNKETQYLMQKYAKVLIGGQ